MLFRSNGEQRAVCQRRGLVSHSVFGEPVDTKIDRFYNIVERELSSGHFVFRDAPNVIRKKLPYISDFLLHGSGF